MWTGPKKGALGIQPFVALSLAPLRHISRSRTEMSTRGAGPAGCLIEQGWPSLVLPAIALEAGDYRVGED